METDKQNPDKNVIITIVLCATAFIALVIGAVVAISYIKEQKKEVVVQKVEVPALVKCPTTTPAPKPAVTQPKIKSPAVAPVRKNNAPVPALKASARVSEGMIRSRIAEIKTPGPIEPVAPIDPIDPIQPQ